MTITALFDVFCNDFIALEFFFFFFGYTGGMKHQNLYWEVFAPTEVTGRDFCSLECTLPITEYESIHTLINSLLLKQLTEVIYVTQTYGTMRL